MWSSLNASFTKILSDTMVGLRGPKGTHIVHRDDLSKNPTAKKVKKGDLLARQENLKNKHLEKKSYGYGDGEEKGVIRVKVKMTKEEASRLMSKCKDGGILEFRDVAHQLVQIPTNRVSVDSSGCGFGGPLRTIHEEI